MPRTPKPILLMPNRLPQPVTHILTPKEYLQKVASGQMPPMDNPQMMQELVEKATENDSTKFMMVEFRDVETPVQPAPQNPQKCK